MLRFVFAATVILVTTVPAFPAEPGIDIAAPRVAISTVDSQSVQFHPDRIVIEQFDFVRWMWLGGIHDTTGAPECLPDGLWSSRLINMNRTFTRLFDEEPQEFDFHCSMHCALGMTGLVVVTPGIPLTVSLDGSQSVQLDWTGGGGIYRLYRSTSPLFTTETTTVLTGAQGLTIPTFTDPTADPPAGTAIYYLVMNFF